jgi:hypothetical protein
MVVGRFWYGGWVWIGNYRAAFRGLGWVGLDIPCHLAYVYALYVHVRWMGEGFYGVFISSSL